MSFICMRMKDDFHIKGWAPTLVLKQKPGGTRKWPIGYRAFGHTEPTAMICLSDHQTKIIGTQLSNIPKQSSLNQCIYLIQRLLWQLGIGNLGIQNYNDFLEWPPDKGIPASSHIPCGIRSLPVLNCYDVYLHMHANNYITFVSKLLKIEKI